jgi:putative glycosyltransferase (TIGR04372 family)
MLAIFKYISRQAKEINTGGMPALLKKLRRPSSFIYNQFIVKFLFAIPALPILLIVRLIRPFFLIRFCRLHSLKIGHLSVNTEIYLCEKDSGLHVPRQRYIDLYFYAHTVISNTQLAAMWSRVIPIWPKWIMEPLFNANRLVPGCCIHEFDLRVQSGRDEKGLLDKFEPHLAFTPAEEAFGISSLNAMGITAKDKFVCVVFRDHAYFDDLLGPGKDARDGYRNSNIQSFSEAAEELVRRGYFVLRMGKLVEHAFTSAKDRIIDYANSPYRSDFMDIYLGAKCAFAVSTGTGWDGIPQVFRRPICYVNFSPLGYFPTSRAGDLFIPKHHFSTISQRKLSLREIFEYGGGRLAHVDSYKANDIALSECSPKELLEIVVEMDERIRHVWHKLPCTDDSLQEKFKAIFKTGISEASISHLHGEIRATIGMDFLRQNQWWLE